MKKIIISLLITGLLPILVQADLYKWKDKTGRINYTDMPPPANVKAENVKAKLVIVTPAQIKAVDKDGKIVIENEKKLDQDASKRQQSAEDQKKLDEQKAEQQKMKEVYCRTARQNLAALANGGRIYKTKDNGEREYMSDDDINQGKQSAQQGINKYCN